MSCMLHPDPATLNGQPSARALAELTRVERGRAGQKIACLAANQRIHLPLLFCDGLNNPVHDGESQDGEVMIMK